MSEEPRETLALKTKPKEARELIAEGDWVALMDDVRFRRILFTLLQASGMFASSYGTDGRNLAMAEGRRSLGLDILRTAQDFTGADALLHILSAEADTQKGLPNGRRSNYHRSRNAELGDGLSRRDIDDGGGLEFADYGNEGRPVV